MPRTAAPRTESPLEPPEVLECFPALSSPKIFPFKGVFPGFVWLSLSFTISPSSSELLESNKKKEELEKQLKESSEEKRMLLEEIAQLRCDIRSAWEQGPSGDTRRMTPALEQKENKFLPWQSSAGSLEGSLKQVRAALPSAPCFLSLIECQNVIKVGWKPALWCERWLEIRDVLIFLCCAFGCGGDLDKLN